MNIKEIGAIIKNLDMELLNILMEMNIMEIGKMI